MFFIDDQLFEICGVCSTQALNFYAYSQNDCFLYLKTVDYLIVIQQGIL